MENNQGRITSIDEYIAAFPEAIQKILIELRATIKSAAPDAEEKISYGMPTFAQHENLVHFAAQKNHIGFYPTPTGIRAFEQELADYESSKGAVQFPIDMPLPLNLITRIVEYRVAENLERARDKTGKRKSS